MRHKVTSHSFGRRQGPRKALIRGLVDSLVEHGRIRTTLPKAKELRRHVERAVTIGKKGGLHARRILKARYPNKNTAFSLVNDIAPRFSERPGGYTRIIKLGARPGDNAPMAFIEFVDYVAPEATTKETVTGDKDAAKRTRQLQKRASAKRKGVRKMQAQSRRINRGK
ncbi:MAG: 50S ribosomal protein L17 [Pseudobdellovibrionaceae bacterium]|nr:50S ribosomal protein L17 [Bdellovibrionales bacterium]USN46253.1 MAG: 50S ribosomal protein L17 [Pseudobdellovibrionaceae bacterium]